MSFLQKEITLPRLRAPKFQRPQASRPRLRGTHLRGVRRSSGAVTGLEIGATQLIAAQAHLQDGRIVADRVVARALPPSLVRDGLVLDPEKLAVELRELFSEHGLSKRVRVGLATPRTVLRVIDLPPVDESEVGAILPMLAQESIPMPLDRAVLDYQTVGIVETPEGRRLRTIVVAAERDGVETIAEALAQAGLRAEGIDLSIFAAMRAVARADPVDGAVLHAQLGDLVNVAVTENGVCRFTRQAPQGLALILARLSEQRGINFQEARELLDDAAAAVAGASSSASPADVIEVGALLSRIARELGSELRATAEFYGTQFGTGVEQGVVTGPLTTLQGFVEALSDASGLSLRSGEATASTAGAFDTVDARVAPVAVGLAIGRVTT
jgi:type IV pilus assembly protein PilM